jgi:hypothetical protein
MSGSEIKDGNIFGKPLFWLPYHLESSFNNQSGRRVRLSQGLGLSMGGHFIHGVAPGCAPAGIALPFCTFWKDNSPQAWIFSAHICVFGPQRCNPFLYASVWLPARAWQQESVNRLFFPTLFSSPGARSSSWITTTQRGIWVLAYLFGT